MSKRDNLIRCQKGFSVCEKHDIVKWNPTSGGVKYRHEKRSDPVPKVKWIKGAGIFITLFCNEFEANQILKIWQATPRPASLQFRTGWLIFLRFGKNLSNVVRVNLVVKTSRRLADYGMQFIRFSMNNIIVGVDWSRSHLNYLCTRGSQPIEY